MNQKFNRLTARLRSKVEMSQTPVTGFVVGVSGTDSIVTLALLHEVAKSHSFNIIGVHYTISGTSTLAKHGREWLGSAFPNVEMRYNYCDRTDDDYIYWGRLHQIAASDRYWTVSTMNATEKYLGTYNVMHKSASISPISSLYKSEVIEISRDIGVPEAIIKSSMAPDCACGRDEFAAENITLIDDVIRHSPSSTMYDAASLMKAMSYIAEKKRDNDFKLRTPYTV